MAGPFGDGWAVLSPFRSGRGTTWDSVVLILTVGTTGPVPTISTGV